MPTLSQLRELVKIESRVKGANNLDTWIDSLINELLANYCQNNRYFEFLTLNEAIPTTLNNGQYDLPINFIALKMVRYKEQATNYIRTLRPRPEFIENANGRRPRWYDVAGNSIVLFNSDDIPANDTILIDYYHYPQPLAPVDSFPIPKLVTPVKLEAIRRTLIYNQQLQEAAMIKPDALEHEVRPKKND